MINYALFTTLCGLASDCSNKYKTKRDFFYFSTIDTQDYIDYPKLYTAISSSKHSDTLKLRLKISTLRLIQLCPKWDFEFTNPSAACEKLKSIHTKFIPSCSIPETPNEIISNLIRFCYTGDYRRYDPLLKMTSSIKLKTSLNFIGRKKDLEELYKAISQSNRVLISGSAGIGKTFFTAYFVHKYSQNFKNICYIKYTNSLDDTLKQVDFSKSDFPEKRNKKDLLKQINPDSLLIIDDVNDTEKQLCAIFTSLKNFSLNIIILSRTPHSFNGIKRISLRPLTQTSLLKIISLSQINQDGLQEALKIFIKSTKHNTLCCASICKALEHLTPANPDSYSDFLESINLFYQTAQIKSEFNFLKYRLLYDHKELNYWGHIKAIEESLTIADKDKTTLYFLSFFGTVPLSTKYLVSSFHLTNAWIKKMIDYGIFIRKNKNNICLNPLISDSLFLRIPKTGIYTRFECYISEISKTLENTIPDWNITPALVELIKHINPFIKPINNTGQQTLSKQQKEWYNLVINTLNFFINNNYPQAALDIIEIFTASDSELLHDKTDLDITLFSISASLLKGNSDDFSLHYKKLEKLIQNKIACNYSNITNFLVTTFMTRILMDFMHYKDYTFKRDLYYRYHTLFLLIAQESMSSELFCHYKFIDKLLYYQQSWPFDLLKAYEDFLSGSDQISLKIQGLSISIVLCFRINIDLLDQNAPQNIIQDVNNHLSKCKHVLAKVINSVDQIALLDYTFALLAYSNYYMLFNSNFETYSYCKTDMELLFSKAPHANTEEFQLLLDMLLNLNHPTV